MKPESRQMIESFCRAMRHTVHIPSTDAESVAKSLRGVATMLEAMERPTIKEAQRMLEEARV